MKIAINSIGPDGAGFSLAEDCESMNLSQVEGVFTEPVKVEVKAQKIQTGFLLEGTIRTVVSLSCSRCLEDYPEKINEDFTWLCKRDSGAGLAEDDDGETIIIGPGDTSIDITDMVREQLILGLPLKPLCQPTCSGLCPGCGANLNTTGCSCPKPADKAVDN